MFTFNPALFSQSLLEQLGGIHSNFIITSDSISMEAEEQILIQRAVSDGDTEHIGDGTLKYGYGYRSLHLEFLSNKTIQFNSLFGRKRKFCQLKLYSDQTLLALVNLKAKDVRMISNQADPPIYSYSINLKSIPIVSLDKTLTIDLVWTDR